MYTFTIEKRESIYNEKAKNKKAAEALAPNIQIQILDNNFLDINQLAKSMRCKNNN